jgi:transcription-repair coupling factor (superfamily II helicase)
VDSERLRLEAYHKLSASSNATNTREDLDKIKAELEDRYGVAPQPVINLLDVTELRQTANRMGLKDVLLIGQVARIAPIEFDEATQVAFSKLYPGARYLATAKTLNIPTPMVTSDREMIDWTWALLEQLNRATN